jgi:pyrroline-5-carboxylate reductase
VGVENIKIGIIGGGVMGRLFLNSLLVLEKEGIEPSNISVSTRQCEDL